MLNNSQQNENCIQISSLKEANKFIPYFKEKFIRLSQLNGIMHKIMKEVKNKDLLTDSIDNLKVNDPQTMDLISSFKMILSYIQEQTDKLNNAGIKFKNFEDGIAEIFVADINETFIWKVTEKSIKNKKNEPTE